MKHSFYLMRPPVIADEDQEAIESYELYDHFALASELWRLTGHPDRASALDDVITSAYGWDVPLLITDDISKLVELLSGISDAVVGTITDSQRIIPVEKLPELRAKAKLLDVAERRGLDATHAVQEAIIDIENLETALRTALKLGAHIVFD